MVAELMLIALSVLLVYIYLGYPVLLGFLACIFPQKHRKDDSHEPSVTLIISAYNEEKVMEAKLENSLGLDYPKDKLTIMVVSDCSTDGTDEIVNAFHHRGVQLVSSKHRCGKTAGLNVAVELIKSDIVVFSDANAMYDKFAVRRMVRHFVDDNVGYVVGHARYDGDAETAAARSESVYWNIEVRLKEWESNFASVVGGDGAIYAIRRGLYEPLQDTDINDFVNPLQIVVKGYRGIFDPESWCTEKPAGQFHKEFARKVRIANRSLNGLLRVPGACNPLTVGRFSLLLVSHKLLRWFSPFLLCAHFGIALVVARWSSFVSCLALVIVVLYGCFALLAQVGWWHDKRTKTRKLFYVPYYLMLMNLASAAGVLMRLRGQVITTWETVREDTNLSSGMVALLPILLSGIAIACCVNISLWLGYGDVLVYASICVLISALFYTYFGYPCILACMAKLKPVHVNRDEQFLPDVTLLIVAYNEEREIEAKLCNSLELDYPRDLLHIVVASDGSFDATNTLTRKFENQGIQLMAYAGNRGKIAALNEAMEGIHSGIVVFSDANVMYDRLAIHKLVRNFSDPRVGVVSGKVVLLNDTLSYGDSEKVYYGIEHFIQEKEGSIGALIGADGAMYAIRRALFRPPSVDTILDDFVIAMMIACKGYLAIHEREAVGYERNHYEVGWEFRRKTRIIAGGFQCLLKGWVIPPPSQPMLLFNFISHKVLRWCNGILVLCLLLLLLQTRFVSSVAVPFFSVALYGMAGALMVAAVAHLIPTIRKIRLVNLLHYLFMLSFASLFGLYRALSGSQRVTWRSGAA